MAGAVGAGLAVIAFGLAFLILALAAIQNGSGDGLLAALGFLGLTGMALALFDLTNNRQRP